jgi:hypothetical protein
MTGVHGKCKLKNPCELIDGLVPGAQVRDLILDANLGADKRSYAL